MYTEALLIDPNDLFVWDRFIFATSACPGWFDRQSELVRRHTVTVGLDREIICFPFSKGEGNATVARSFFDLRSHTQSKVQMLDGHAYAVLQTSGDPHPAKACVFEVDDSATSVAVRKAREWACADSIALPPSGAILFRFRDDDAEDHEQRRGVLRFLRFVLRRSNVSQLSPTLRTVIGNLFIELQKEA